MSRFPDPLLHHFLCIYIYPTLYCYIFLIFFINHQHTFQNTGWFFSSLFCIFIFPTFYYYICLIVFISHQRTFQYSWWFSSSLFCCILIFPTLYYYIFLTVFIPNQYTSWLFFFTFFFVFLYFFLVHNIPLSSFSSLLVRTRPRPPPRPYYFSPPFPNVRWVSLGAAGVFPTCAKVSQGIN